MGFGMILPSYALERVQIGLSLPVEVFNVKATIVTLFQNSRSWRNELKGTRLSLQAFTSWKEIEDCESPLELQSNLCSIQLKE